MEMKKVILAVEIEFSQEIDMTPAKVEKLIENVLSAIRYQADNSFDGISPDENAYAQKITVGCGDKSITDSI